MAKRFVTDVNYAGIRAVIMKMKTEGMSNVEIGKRIGVSEATVRRIARSEVYEQYQQAGMARGHCTEVDEVIQEMLACLQALEDVKTQVSEQQEEIRNTIARLQMVEVENG